MIFLLAINILVLCSIFPAVAAARMQIKTKREHRRVALNFFAAICLLAPLFLEFYGTTRSGGVPLGGSNLLPLLLLATGSSVLLGFHVHLMFRHWQLNQLTSRITPAEEDDPLDRLAGKKPHATFKISLCTVITAAYVLFTVADHFTFFHEAEGVESGVLYLQALREMSEVKDVRCDADWLLVQDIAGAERERTVFRCPNATSFAIGRNSGQPFVAWPGYIEGESQELAAALKALFKSAVNLPGS